MTDQSDGRDDALIGAYRDAVKQRTNAGRLSTMIVLVIIVLFALDIKSSFQKFAEEEKEAFLNAVSDEVVTTTAMYGDDVRAAINNVGETYVDEFQTMLSRDSGMIRSAAMKELKLLEKNTEARWPEMQEGLSDLIFIQEVAIRQELAAILGEEKADQIATLYASHEDGAYAALLPELLPDHYKVATEIGQKVQALADQEDDILPPVDVMASLGMLLELTGKELQ